MRRQPKPGNILHSLKILRGNTRLCVVVEPMWGIPYVLYNFYLSLYMRAQGVSDQQIGFLISLSFIAGSIFSFFAGVITDSLGRKKTTLIFDLLCWPVSILIYMVSRGFWGFALATIVGSLVRVVVVSWNLLVVEDAVTEERVAAYNLLNIINVAMGVTTPLAGLLVRRIGVVAGERILMGFAVVSMTAMMLVRNHYLKETAIGREILAERRGGGRSPFANVLASYGRIFEALRVEPKRRMILVTTVLFNTYVPIGTFASLYYAPYLTEALRLEKSSISILGSVNSLVLFLVLALVTPKIAGHKHVGAMILGLTLQAFSLFLFIVVPRGNFYLAAACVALFAIGYGLYRPFMDSTLAEVTEGRERAGLYALQNVAVSVLSATMGFISGFLYHLNPILIYLVSIGILLACIMVLVSYSRKPAPGMDVRGKREMAR
ncbi:MAG: MFS transporter [Bacteroidota bacterium]